MPLPELHTVTDVAKALGETPRYVSERCRRHEWPHRRGARGRVTFTADDFARILELIAEPEAEVIAPRLSFAPRSRRLAS